MSAPAPPRRESAALRLRVLGAALRGIRRAWPAMRVAATLWRRTALRGTLLVAVVGSYGKTTTTRAIRQALGLPVAPGARRSAGSFLALELLRVRPGARVAVLEVGIDGPGQMAPLARMLAPDVVVATAIGMEHLTSMGTLDVTRREKGEMVRALRPRGLLVLRADDPRVRSYAGESPARSVLFGYASDADVRADQVRVDWPHGTAFRVHLGAETHAARVGVIGRDMVPAALAALAVARHAGVPAADALARLAVLRPTVGRLEPVALASGAYALRDDWKGSFETAHVALAALAEVPARRRIVVMGDLSEVPAPFGDSMRAVGAHVARIADHAVLATHGKASQAVASGAVRAGLDRDRIARPGFAARGVFDALPADLGPGDVVLLKGSRRQRMGRVALALAGTPVTCWIETCAVKLDCEQCPLLCAAPGRDPHGDGTAST